MSSPYEFQCDKCGRIVDERKETVWNEVIGWEKRRVQGGTNHLALRKPQPNFRCNVCMTKMLEGLDAGQSEMF
jgi:hypothetical protein